MDETSATTIRMIELVAQAEDVAKANKAATDWLDPRTLAALVAAHQAVLDYDMDVGLEAVKHPEVGQVVAAHERLRQVVALAFVLGAAASPTFVLEIEAYFLNSHPGSRTALN